MKTKHAPLDHPRKDMPPGISADVSDVEVINDVTCAPKADRRAARALSCASLAPAVTSASLAVWSDVRRSAPRARFASPFSVLGDASRLPGASPRTISAGATSSMGSSAGAPLPTEAEAAGAAAGAGASRALGCGASATTSDGSPRVAGAAAPPLATGAASASAGASRAPRCGAAGAASAGAPRVAGAEPASVGAAFGAAALPGGASPRSGGAAREEDAAAAGAELTGFGAPGAGCASAATVCQLPAARTASSQDSATATVVPLSFGRAPRPVPTTTCVTCGPRRIDEVPPLSATRFESLPGATERAPIK